MIKYLASDIEILFNSNNIYKPALSKIIGFLPFLTHKIMARVSAICTETKRMDIYNS